MSISEPVPLSAPVNGIDPTGTTTIVEYKFTIGGRTFSIALHGGHHSWRILGKTVFCIHIQLLTFLNGVKGSGFRKQIPLPWCKGARF